VALGKFLILRGREAAVSKDALPLVQPNSLNQKPKILVSMPAMKKGAIRP
jgi:hypothetical protein